MTFRANAYATGLFGHGLTALFLLVAVSLLHMREYLLLLALCCVIIAVAARLYSRKMTFDDTTFRYDSWLRSIEIPYTEIVKVENAEDLGYPVDRWHGPLEYRITTKRDAFWVSMLWFNSDAAKLFYRRILKRK